MNTSTGLPACNFCTNQQTNPTTAGWFRLKGTLVDICPVCAAKSVADIANNFTLAVPPPAPGATGQVPVPLMVRVQMPDGSVGQIPAGTDMPPGARPLPAGIAKPAPTPVAGPGAMALKTR